MKKNHVRKYMRRWEIRRVWKKAVSILSCIVVFVTTYMLLLPAITMEKTAICGIEAHQHDESCWETETKLTCGLDEEDGHQHTDDCFTTTRKLICTLEQHTHSEQCFNIKKQPSCALEEHSHTDECFREDRLLSCPLEETADHQHTEDCYEREKVLICGKEAHTHTAECFGEDASGLSSGPEGTEAVEEGFNETVDAAGNHDPETESGEGLTYENTQDTEHGASAESSTPDESISDENGTENIFDENGIENIFVESGDEAAGMTDPETGELSGNNEETETGTEDTEILDPSDGSDGFDGSDEDEASDSETADPSLEDGEIETVDPETGENSGENETSDAETAESSEENEASDAETGENSGENETSDAETAESSEENGTSDAETGENSGENETSDAETAESSEENGISDAETADSNDENGPDDAGEAASSEGAESTEAAAEAAGEGSEGTQTASESASGAASGTTSGEAKPGLSKTLTFEGPDYTVMASFDENAGIPSGASLSVEEITQDQDNYKKYSEQAEKAVGEEIEGKAAWVRLFDITIVKDGQTIEPTGPVSVQINYHEAMERPKNAEVKAVHFEGEKETPVVLDTKAQGEETSVEQVSFDTESFSVFAIVGTTIEKTVLASDGKNYKITVTYGPEAEIPEGAELAVEEILPGSPVGTEGCFVYYKNYEEYVAGTEEALGIEEGSIGYIRLFDISIVNKNDHNIKCQPAEGTTVDVRIELADSGSNKLSVVHFAENYEGGVIVDNSTESSDSGSIVIFPAYGFSVYSIVDAPEPASVDPVAVVTLEELAQNYGDSKGFILSYGGSNYFTNNINNNSAYIETNFILDASHWFFEDGGEENKYYIYTISNGEKKYMYNKSGNLMDLRDTDKTLFELSRAADGKFYFKTMNNKYLQHSNGGKGIRLHEDKNANGQITLTYVSSLILEKDPYSLDGKTFGIAYHDDSTLAAALSATSKTVSDQSRLEDVDMLIRNNVLTNDGILLVAEDSDIQEWTFESIEEDKYYIKTTVEGVEKYLTINNGNVTLVDSQADASQIQAMPGTGTNSGKWHFTFDGYSLNFSGTAANGFNAANDNPITSWLNLVEKSTLTEEDFVSYSARKISASDDVLSATEKDVNGDISIDDEGNPVYKEEKSKVVVYTRVWNETTKKYEFYAIDHDGTLVRIYESGDLINWVGNQVNSVLWEFTEYTNDDGTPSYFYELQNTAYPNTYLVPQSNGFVSDHAVGINLNGRRDGFDYTTILAWDDNAYGYSGLKVVTNENGGKRVVTCPMDDANDFYFAVIDHINVSGKLSTVDTIDNKQYGITMKMIDYNNPIQNANGGQGNNLNARDSGQTAVLGYNTDKKDLLSTNLENNGYPNTNPENTGKPLASLGELYNSAGVANHLFIQSVYNESGYFEYDSTQNFAHLESNGDFTVYDQLGAIGDYKGSAGTGEHGQFMPYNIINPGQSCTFVNRTDVLHQELPDSDPRKGEILYNIGDRKNVDYFFGMELSANFTQTPNGLDNWGHDIIFEFSGDDDFWFYVDGELVLDLGGVHSAMVGSVNFRTGVVNSTRGNSTLYNIFKSHYQNRGMSESEVNAKLNEIFENKDGNYVFRDYTTHTMKMFYMERGGGASNLKMRFNLASVQPGTVELSKKVTGTQSASNKLMQYPYQIWYATANYKTNPDGSYVIGADGKPEIESYNNPRMMEQAENAANPIRVVYKGTKKLVPFVESLTIDGIEYQNVFLLKAGETAVIMFPENTYQYKTIECGIDTEVYEKVFVNGQDITSEGRLYNNSDGESSGSGESSGDGESSDISSDSRMDFGIGYETAENRPKVDYTNQVAPGVMRTLSFKKAVYGPDGNILPDDQAAMVDTTFSFRLYLGNEFADADNLPLADMYKYYIKDPDDYYVQWNAANKSFIPTTAKTFSEFLALDENVRRSATFTTSMYGAISKIRAGYTVEVQDLIVGTKYKVEERDREIPKGFTRRASDGYVRTDLDNKEYVYYTDSGSYGRHELTNDSTTTAEAITDTIASKDESPQIEIRNQEGWGLTARKVWTDKDFMTHDPIYLAIYLREGTEPNYNYTLLPEKVMRLTNSDTEAYFFFQDLAVDGTTYSFDQFVVREVKLTGDFSVDNSTGIVTLSDVNNVTLIDDGNTIEVGGTPAGGTHKLETYTVSYQTGGSTGRNHNIRNDTVKNSRPGIKFCKTGWDGVTPLAGTGFTLKKANDGDDAGSSLISDNSGLITIAYLDEGTYTLTEVETPKGYVGLPDPITVNIAADKSVTFTLGDDSPGITVSPEGTVTGSNDYFTVEDGSAEDMTAIVTIKNRQNGLHVFKEEAGTNNKISGVHFALYEQVLSQDGTPRKSYTPKGGYEDLITTEQGLLQEITMNLPAGTYYLTETQAKEGYRKLDEDIIFTIGADGTFSVNSTGHSEWLTTNTDTNGLIAYTLVIPNGRARDLTFHKVWYPFGDSTEKLTWQKDITVALYKESNDTDIEIAEYTIGMTGEGLQVNALSKITGEEAPEIVVNEVADNDYSFTIKNLPFGDDFYLTEREMEMNLIKYGKWGTSDVEVVNGMSKATEAVPYIINRDTGSYELPATGGPGTKLVYLLGTILTSLAGAGLVVRKRRKT